MTHSKGERKSFASLSAMAQFVGSGAVDLVDCCFVDPLGIVHHCTFHPSQCEEKDLKAGFAFDGSSIRLFTTIDQSDMVMKPDPMSCWIDPFCDRPTLHVYCSIEDPYGKPFARCPRQIASKLVEYVKQEGIADTVIFGPEAEFFVFDDVRYSVGTNKVQYEVDGVEGYWNSSKEVMAESSCCGKESRNLAHRACQKGFYFPVAPIDSMMNLRAEMLLTMGDIGLPIEKHHHEVATCQAELGFACSTLVATADNVLTYKYVVKNVAAKHGKTATFMPKPLFGDNGTGMHCHQSLWKEGENLFFDEKASYCKLSELSLQYIAGLLHHASAVLAFTNPTVNSYKRLVPGYEAPVNLVFSKGNRSAAIRIPLMGMNDMKAKRIEFRCPDPACCPHIAFAVMTLAGIDGIKKKMKAPTPVDKDIYELPPEEKATIQSTPPSLEAALDALEKDHDFLTTSGVFTEDFILAYIAFKRAEAKSISLVPHPKEFELYYHC